MRKGHIFYILFLFLVLSCQPQSMDMNTFDIQGHRGCRGILPENCIPAFIKAMEIGVHTLEMDVVISKDHQVVVSHEPWLSDEICILGRQLSKEERNGLTPEEIRTALEEKRETNIYKLNYDEIALFDCGSKPHPRFPDQERLGVSKPLLSDVFKVSEQFAQNKNAQPIQYNIEIKRKAEHDGVFHPDMKTFADLVVKAIDKSGVKDRVTLQCFDVETLQYLHKAYPAYQLVFLVENEEGIAGNMDKLGFTPQVYSPYFKLLDPASIDYAHKKDIKVIPWTVNESEDIEAMIDLGVDGIISDYPDRLVNIVNKLKESK